MSLIVHEIYGKPRLRQRGKYVWDATIEARTESVFGFDVYKCIQTIWGHGHTPEEAYKDLMKCLHR